MSINLNDSSYQCPGCGEHVDKGRMDEVLAHHQHVLHRSNAFSARSLATQPEHREATRAETARRTFNGSPDAAWRRYGHETNSGR